MSEQTRTAENLTDPVVGQATTAGDPSPATAAPPAAPPPTSRYILGEEIARGGMGVVCRATDTVLARDLAVKMLQERFGPGSGAAGRFATEARITARLQHPAIPPVHDLGTLPDGRPFLAMKLVEGQTLDRLLRGRADPGDDRGRLVAAFEQVCQAVGYAHSRGVVHRDLKPQNVMVGAFGEVQVMDWGLAKALGSDAGVPEEVGPSAARTWEDGDDATRTGSAKGTPAYMPPEQARGEWDRVDARADVFALGGILAVVLTGRPPYAGSSARAVMTLAAEADLDPAFARLDGCGADPELVALCKRCLSPDPAARPADAGEVAGLVAEYRAGQEDRTRRAELDRVRAVTEAREQRKRRRVQLALAAAVGSLLLAGGAFGLWRERDAAARALEDARQASEARGREVRNRDALVASLGRCEDSLRGGDREAAAAALADVEKRFTEGGAEGYGPRLGRCRAETAFLTELDSVDAFRWTPARGKLPDRQVVAGRWAEAFAGFGIVPGSTPPAEVGRRVKESLIRDRLLAALDVWLVLAPSPDLAEILHAADPEEYRDAVRVAVAAKDWSEVEALVGRSEASAQPARFAIALGAIQEVPEEERQAILKQAALARPSDLAVLMVLGALGGDDRAGLPHRVRWYQGAVASHPRNSAAWLRLGTALHDLDDTAGAVAAFRRAIAVDPSNAYAHYNLGTVLGGLGDKAGAIVAYRESIKLDPTYSPTHNNLGLALRAVGDGAGAVAEYREAIRLDRENTQAYFNLAQCLSATGDRPGAIATYRDLLAVAPGNARANQELGSLLYQTGDKAGAEAAFRASIEADPTYPYTHYNLGVVLAEAGDKVGALAEYRETVRLAPKFSHGHNNLANMLRSTGDKVGAIAEYREAVRLDPGNASAHHNLGITLEEQGDEDAAVAAYRATIRANPKHVAARANLGRLLHARGDLNGAAEAYREAVRLAPDVARYRSSLDVIRLERALRGPDVAPAPRDRKP